MAVSLSGDGVRALAEVVLPDDEGDRVRLGDLWLGQPAVLVWLRHYGWVHCRGYAVQLDRARGEFEAAGAHLVLIGQGSPRQTSHFRRRQELSMPLLCDEERESYKLAGAKIGAMHELIGPKSVLKGLATTARTGQLQGRPVGNVAQLGGAMVVAPGDRVVFTHMAKDAADNAGIDQILRAAKAAATPSPHHRRA